MTIGSRIRARRNELKLSQRELAARLGYTDHTTLTRIEAGKVELTQSKIVKFAEVLGVTPGYLMGWEDTPEDLGAFAASVLQNLALLQLVQDYLILPEEDQVAVCTLVTNLAKKQKKD